MNDIKFRFFRTKKKEMVYGFKHCSTTYVLDMWENEKHVSKPMQYTGLKDKNGTEIYEGDIVNYPHIVSAKSEWEVVFRKGSFVIKQKCLGISFSEIAHINNLEIIGNIYEDKHLLEVQT